MAGALRERLIRLTGRYRTLQRGGLSFHQLREIAVRWGARHQLHVHILLLPWPESGSVQRAGDTVGIFINSRANVAERTYALAHEVGHLLLGHYDTRDVWFLLDGPRACDWEDEADCFAAFATRTPKTPAEWFASEQCSLLF